MGLAHAPYGWRLPPAVPHTAQLLAERGLQHALVGMQHLIERGSAHELGYRACPAGRARLRGGRGRHRRCCASWPLAIEPFYLEVGFEEPHRPYDFGGAEPDTSRGVSVPGYLPDAPEARAGPCRLPGRHSPDGRGVGRILAALDELGSPNRTCVVFATDHGAAMPRAKCTLYDPGIEVALLWRWPARDSAAGASYRELVSNVDVTPTLLDGLGLRVPAGRAGSQFLAAAAGQCRITSATKSSPKRRSTPTTSRCARPHRAAQADRQLRSQHARRRAQRYPPESHLSADAGRVRWRSSPIELYDLTPTRGSSTTWRARPSWRRSKPICVSACSRGCATPTIRSCDGPVASPYYADAVFVARRS